MGRHPAERALAEPKERVGGHRRFLTPATASRVHRPLIDHISVAVVKCAA
jgi:hypothetical protein